MFYTNRVYSHLRVVVNTFDLSLKVGRALKSVDARLLSEWTTWTGGAFPPAHCQVSKAQAIAQMHFLCAEWPKKRSRLPDSRLSVLGFLLSRFLYFRQREG